jgi:hypothetical protein
MYNSYSFTTSALDGGERSASRAGRALPPGRGPPVPIVQEAGWASELIWTRRLEGKSFASAGERISIAQSPSPQPVTVLSYPGPWKVKVNKQKIITYCNDYLFMNKLCNIIKYRLKVMH